MTKLAEPYRRPPEKKTYKTSIFKRLKEKRARLAKKGLHPSLIALYPRGSVEIPYI